jgi:hypothetical protein
LEPPALSNWKKHLNKTEQLEITPKFVSWGFVNIGLLFSYVNCIHFKWEIMQNLFRSFFVGGAMHQN